MIRIYHPTNRNNNRIKEIDFLRGFLILLMVMDHLFFDFGQLIYIISNFSMDQSLLSQFVKLSSSYLSWDFRINFRIFVVMLFFFISGISFQFSKNNNKRGVILLSIGILLTLGSIIVSYILKEDFVIIASIFLTFGLAILITNFIYFVINKILKNNTISSLFLVIIGLLGAIYFIDYTFNINVPIINKIESFNDLIDVILGYKQYGFDDIPLLINLTAMLIGFGIGKLVYPNRKSLFSYFNKKIYVKPSKSLKLYNEKLFARKKAIHILLTPFSLIGRCIEFFGRHSLYVYIIHQFVLIPILIICLISNGFNLTL
ncbi:MAG: heparan-alpha-glucosaminide N-acetyltransferase domain-containing protein [Bacilli bacterium]|nr:heparan-alpha-glucosaminide N-acetyltransferase domain-containing protein [Bacilli bacterium]MDY5832394.1 heparan-alpha-glucosaminide N-acetyltransferase domain-containing protein [Candidatus Onthovivens sp.]